MYSLFISCYILYIYSIFINSMVKVGTLVKVNHYGKKLCNMYIASTYVHITYVLAMYMLHNFLPKYSFVKLQHL